MLKLESIANSCQISTFSISVTDLSSLRRLLETMISTYSTITFDETGALTSRLIARRTNSFRSQAGFKQLRKTNIALCRLKDIDFINVLENFLGTLPDYIVEGSKLSLPTYENYQFVMLRLQSLSKLLLRIAVCSRESLTIFRDMIQRNFFIEISALYIGLLAQIWDLAKQLSLRTRDFYNALYPYKKYFRKKSKQNVESQIANVDLCEKLETFLTEVWTNEFFGNFKNQSLEKSTTELGIDFGDFNDDGDNILSIHEENKKPTQTIQLRKINRQEFHKIESKKEIIQNDIGVPISRDSLQEMINIDRIVRTEEISKLINEEQQLRDQKCAKRTKRLNDSQWKDLKSKVRNILVTSEGRICIKKFKNLWKSVTK